MLWPGPDALFDAIAAGAGELFVCGGVESMSRVPMLGFNPVLNPRLSAEKPDSYIGMGMTAENLAMRYQIDRTAQQEFAVTSQQRAAAAQAGGRFADEIVPIQTKGGTVDQDGCIRAETTQEGLSGLKPAFLACLPSGKRLQVSRLNIRAMIAEELYRASITFKESFANAEG